MLTPTIDGCLARQYDDNQLQTLILLLEVFEHWLDLLDAVGVLAEARLAHDRHAGVVADALQLLGEVAQGRLVAGALLRETSDRPHLYFDARVELFAAHVPHALIRQHGYFGLFL